MQGDWRTAWRVFSCPDALLLLVCLALAGCTHRPEVLIHTAHGPVAVQVEVADTPDARARGLMYRNDLARDAGMLFIFPSETRQEFWMKNTPLPLDMIFIGQDRRVVGIVSDTRPFTTNPLGVEAPSRYVLEVHAGFSASHGIAGGNQVDFVRVPNAVE